MKFTIVALYTARRATSLVAGAARDPAAASASPAGRCLPPLLKPGEPRTACDELAARCRVGRADLAAERS